METNVGYCHCCRSGVTFTAYSDDLRNNYVCDNCGSIPRMRHLHYVLDRTFVGWEQMVIHESSPSSPTNFVQSKAENYSFSQFFPGVPSGESKDGVLCQDLQQMSLPDQSVQLFITQDVFEHVPEPKRAAREIARVLNPGGSHVFSVPVYGHLEKSRPRVAVHDGQVVPILPQEYHESPVGDGKALVTWDYSVHDFADLMTAWSGLPVSVYSTRDRNFGIDGYFNDIYVMRKPRAVE